MLDNLDKLVDLILIGYTTWDSSSRRRIQFVEWTFSDSVSSIEICYDIITFVMVNYHNICYDIITFVMIS